MIRILGDLRVRVQILIPRTISFHYSKLVPQFESIITASFAPFSSLCNQSIHSILYIHLYTQTQFRFRESRNDIINGREGRAEAEAEASKTERSLHCFM